MSAPTVVTGRRELREATDAAGTVALVPTMGALHAGHEELLRHARPLGDLLVASIFVNPTQFAPDEDFDVYPRTLDADLRVCAEAGVDVVFLPDTDTVYPGGTRDIVTVDPGPLGQILEGASRPTHFRGVLTVVAKLFGLVRPDVAVFGQKDYQQLVLIRKMARELCQDIQIVGCPIVRDEDGVAMSSRNQYLGASERATATALFRALNAGADEAHAGAEAVLKAAGDVLDSAQGIDVDYLRLTDADLGDPAQGRDARLLVAARVGKTRLLDNTGLVLGSEIGG